MARTAEMIPSPPGERGEAQLYTYEASRYIANASRPSDHL
jgi:hypothetical protein